MKDDASDKAAQFNRRTTLKTLGVSAIAGLAGCATETDQESTEADNNEATKTGSSGSDDNVIRLGYVTPLSGPSRVYGLPHEAGHNIALEEINGNGGVDVGGTSYEFELLSRDGEGDPTVSKNAATELIEDENVDLFIGGNIPTAVRGYIDIIEDTNTFIMFDGNESAELHFIDYEYKISPYVAQYSPNYPDLSRMYPMGTHAVEVFGYEDISFVTPKLSYGFQAEKWMSTAVERAGGNVVDNIQVENGTEDYSSVITQLSSSDPDAILNLLFPFDFFRFLEQAHQRGLKDQTDIFTVEVPTEETANEITSPEVLSNFYEYGLTPRSMQLAVENGKLEPGPYERLVELREKFNEQFPDRAFNYVASMSYEGLNLLKHAIESAGSFENDPLIDAFSNITYPDINDFTTQYYVPAEGSVTGNQREGNLFDEDLQAYMENTVLEWQEGNKQFIELLRVGDYWE